jgi:hypothetical protein
MVLVSSHRTQSPDNVALAFDRLGWVRVVVHNDDNSYELVGTAHRRPRTCPVSAATASALIDAGLPKVVCLCPECTA